MPISQPIIGLALGSGAAKGWAHIGVIRALVDHGYEPRVVAGSSIGAVVGAVYVNNQLDALESWARKLTSKRKFMFMDFRPRSGGLVSGKRLMQVLTDHVGPINIQDCPIPFGAVATSYDSGREIWLRHGPVVRAVRASMAIPGVFSPVFLRNQWLLDGGLSNPVPVSLTRALGADLVFAVDLNGDNTGYDEGSKADEKRQAGVGKAQAISLSPGLEVGEAPAPPSIANSFFSAITIMSNRLARGRLAGDPPDVIIAPRLGHMSGMEFEQADAAINEGYAAVVRVLPLIESALSRYPFDHPH
jgi:NTE family protein